MSKPEGSQESSSVESVGESSDDLENLEAIDGEPIGDGSVKDGRVLREVMMLSQHRGPLPSEAWLQAVERIEPGTTKRLVDDFVVNREHYRVLQARAIEIDHTNFKAFARYQSLQLLATFVVVIVIAGAGVTLIALGESTAGLVAILAELVALAGVFMGQKAIESYGRKSDDDREGPQ